MRGLEKQKPILRQRGPRYCQWCPSNSTGRLLHAEPLTSRGVELSSPVPQTRAAPLSPASVFNAPLGGRTLTQAPLLVFCRVFYKVKSRSAHMKSHAEQEKKAAALRQKEAEERAARAAAEAAAILAARQQNGTRQMSGDSTNDDSSDGEDDEDEDWQ